MVIRDAKVKAVPPLHVACRDRDVDTVLRLISLDDSGTVVEGSVDVNEKDDGSGWTALHVVTKSSPTIHPRRSPFCNSIFRSSPPFLATSKLCVGAVCLCAARSVPI